MRGSKSIILQLIAFFSFSFGAVINESTNTTCPSDPTFGGKCQLKEVKKDGASCKTINGINVCRDWWKKEYVYECQGQDNDALFKTFENQSYCRLVSKCKKWEDVGLKGGNVSCRIYIDKNRPGCESNPDRAECVADDCGDIKSKCTFQEYIPFGDITDKGNNTPSGINLGTYVYECPSSVRKVCREYQYELKCPAQCPNGTKVDCPDNSNQAKCPDGSIATCKTENCNTVKTCTQYETVNVKATEIKNCLAQRNYTKYTVPYHGSQAENLRNDPNCIKIGEEDAGTISGDLTKGICADHYAYAKITYDTNTNTYKVVLEGTSPDGEVGKNCGSGYWSVDLFSNKKEGIAGFVFKSTGGSGGGCYFYQNQTTAFDNWIHWATCPVSDQQYPTGNFHYDFYLKNEIFICYNNTIDTSNCSSLSSNCTLQDNLNDLSSLACNKFAVDVENSYKKLCAEYSIQYECPSTITKQECKKYETKSVCNGVSYPIKDVEVESKDFSNDFNKAVALAQLANELKHIWAGRYMRCDSGWFSSVLEDPTEYFTKKLVSFIVLNYGGQFLSAANIFVKDYLGYCVNPGMGVDNGSMATCMGNAAKLAWQDTSYSSNGGMMQNMLQKMGFNPNNITSFLTDPFTQFAISVAIDIITSTQQCNACTSKSCAEKHNFYDTYGLLKGGNCHFVESKCAWKTPLGCLRKKYMYCCYDSTFARILVEQAYKQLGYSFSGGNCSALTFDDIKRLDFSKMDFSELQNYLEAKMKGQIDPNLIKGKINNYFDTDYGKQNFTGETPYNN